MSKPPTDPKAEIAAALVKGAVSIIPFVGPIISEVGNLYLNPLEKRKKQWINEVSLAIDEIERRFSLLPESLETNERFISFLYQATILALKNHQREKIHALKSSLVSAADPASYSEDMAFQFLRYIDELSTTHLRMLASLEKYAMEFAGFEELEQVYGKLQSLTGMSFDRATFRSFVRA